MVCRIILTKNNIQCITFLVATSGSKYYRAIINRISDRSGAYATFNLPSVSYPSSRSGVLSFRFYYYTTNPRPKYGSLRVTACEGEDPIFSEGNLLGQWYFRQVRFNCASSVKISFTAIRGSNPTTIGVDDISLTEIRHTTTELVTTKTLQATTAFARSSSPTMSTLVLNTQRAQRGFTSMAVENTLLFAYRSS
nr:uncharacterized protein LOC129280463 [Lytechinus pictus]